MSAFFAIALLTASANAVQAVDVSDPLTSGALSKDWTQALGAGGSAEITADGMLLQADGHGPAYVSRDNSANGTDEHPLCISIAMQAPNGGEQSGGLHLFWDADNLVSMQATSEHHLICSWHTGTVADELVAAYVLKDVPGSKAFCARCNVRMVLLSHAIIFYTSIDGQRWFRAGDVTRQGVLAQKGPSKIIAGRAWGRSPAGPLPGAGRAAGKAKGAMIPVLLRDFSITDSVPSAQVAALQVAKQLTWEQTAGAIDPAGVPPKWTLLGPLADAELGKKQFYAPDTSDDWSTPPKDPAGQPIKAPAEPNWTRPEADTDYYVDLPDLFGRSPNTLLWTKTNVNWPVDGEALLWFDSAEPITLYINNSIVFNERERPYGRSRAMRDGRCVSVALKKGNNVIKVRSHQTKGDSGFYLRLERDDPEYRIGLLEALLPLFPESADQPVGRAARLEIIQRYESELNFRQAIAACDRAITAFSLDEGARLEAFNAKIRILETLRDREGMVRAADAFIALQPGAAGTARALWAAVRGEVLSGKADAAQARVKRATNGASPEVVAAALRNLAAALDEAGDRARRLETLDELCSNPLVDPDEHVRAAIELAMDRFGNEWRKLNEGKKIDGEGAGAFTRAAAKAIALLPGAKNPMVSGLAAEADTDLKAAKYERALGGAWGALLLAVCASDNDSTAYLSFSRAYKLTVPEKIDDATAFKRELSKAIPNQIGDPAWTGKWRYVGFSFTANTTPEDVYGPEKHAELGADFGNGKKWTELDIPADGEGRPNAYNTEHGIDLFKDNKKPGCDIAFAARDFECSEAMDTFVQLSPAGPWKAWLDDKAIGENAFAHYRLERDRIPIHVEKGKHHLLLRLEPTGAGTFLFRARISRESELAIELLTQALLLRQFPAQMMNVVWPSSSGLYNFTDSKTPASVWTTLGLAYSQLFYMPQANPGFGMWFTLADRLKQNGDTGRMAAVLQNGMRALSERGEFTGKPGVFWEFSSRLFDALASDGKTWAADGILRDACSRYPVLLYRDMYGWAVFARGQLRRDQGLLLAVPYFDRAGREAYPLWANQQAAVDGLNWARTVKSDRLLFEASHELQSLLDAARRQLSSETPDDVDRAMRNIADTLQSAAGSTVSIDNSPSAAHLVGAREYIRAVLASLPEATREVYRSAVASASGARLRAALQLNDPAQLEEVADEFYYTPASQAARNRAGNLYFDRGQYSQAASMFQILLREPRLPNGGGGGGGPPPGILLGKLAVSLLRMGDVQAAAAALDQLTSTFGAEKVSLGGEPIEGAALAQTLRKRFPQNVTAEHGPDEREPSGTTYLSNLTRTGPRGGPSPEIGGVAWAHALIPTPDISGAGGVEFAEILSHPPTFPLSDGTRVYSGALNSISAFDQASGKKLWSNSWGLGGIPLKGFYFNGFPSTCPTIANGNLYMRALESRVFSYRCYNCATGKLRWTTEAVPELKGVVWLCDPAVAYGLAFGVYLSPAGDMNQHGLAAIDVETGRLRWKTNLATGYTGLNSKAGSNWSRDGFNLATLHLGPPAVDGGEVYAFTGLTSIVAINAFSGDVRWLRSFPKLNFNEVRADGGSGAGYDNRMREATAYCNGPLSPMVTPETILLAPKDGSGLLAFDRQTGALRWRKDIMNCRYIAGLCGNNALVCEDSLMAINIDSGVTAWEYDPAANIYGQPGYSGNVVYLPTEKELLRIDAHTGLPLTSVAWDSRIGPCSNLVVGSDRVIGIGNGAIAAFGLKGTAAAKLPELDARELETAGKFEAAADAYRAIIAGGCEPEEALSAVSAEIRILEKLGKRDAALEALAEFEKSAPENLAAAGGIWKVKKEVFANSIRKRFGQNVPDSPPVENDLSGVLGYAWQLPGENAQLIYPPDGPRDRLFVRYADTLGCIRLKENKDMLWQSYIGTEAAEIAVGPNAIAVHSAQKITTFDRDTGCALAAINAPEVAKRGRKPVKAGNFGLTALDESRVFAVAGNWLFAWDLRSGTLAWKRDITRNVTAANGLAVNGGALMCIYRCREEGNFIEWFDAKTGDQLKQPLNIGGQGDNIELCFSPDRSKLAFRGNAEFICVDTIKKAVLWKNPIPRLDSRSGKHKVIHFEPNVITYSGINKRENDKWTTHWWDPETGKELRPAANKGSVTKIGSDYLALYTDKDNYRLVREDAKGAETAKIPLQESLFYGLALQRVFYDKERTYLLFVRSNNQDQFVLWSATWGNAPAIVDQQNLPGTASRLDWATFDIQAVQYGNMLVYNSRDGIYALSMQGETSMDAAEKRKAELRAGGLTLERTVDARCALYSFEQPSMRALEAPANLRLDGNPADWASEPLQLQGPIDFVPIMPDAKWGGASDLSARVYTGWNREGVVVAVDVTDDTLVAPTPGLEATTGDSIRVLLCSRAPGTFRPDPNETVSATLAWGNGQTMLTCEHPVTKEAVLQGHVSRSPNEKGYRYQLFVPWVLLRKDPAQRPGDQLRLNLGVSVYDDDGAGIKGALELGACISAPHFAPDMLGNIDLLDISQEKIERIRKVIALMPDSDEAFRFLELIMLSKTGPKADDENIAELEAFVKAHPASPVAVRAAGRLRVLYGRSGDAKAAKSRLETLLHDAKVQANSQAAIEGVTFHIWVYPDAKEPPRSLMLAFQSWEYNAWRRCYWGPARSERANDRLYMGPMPPAGQWTELTVHNVDIGLQEGVRSLNLPTFGGSIYFDRITLTSGGKEQVLMADHLPDKWKVDHNPIRFVDQPKRDQFKPFTFGRNQQNAIVVDPLLSMSDKQPLFTFASDSMPKLTATAYTPDVLRKAALAIADTPDGLRLLQRVLDTETGQTAVDEVRSFLQSNNGTPNDLPLIKLLYENYTKVLDPVNALSQCSTMMVDLKISRDVRRAFYAAYAPAWSEWNIIGPFVAAGERRGMDNILGPENGVDLAGTIKLNNNLNGKALSWQKISNKLTKDKKPNGDPFVDLRRHSGMAAARNEAHFAYAYYKFPVTKERKVYMYFGAKEAISIWLNHKLVVDDRESTPRQDAEWVEVTLGRGDNEILIKVASREALGFIFRLGDIDGKPLEDVKNQ